MLEALLAFARASRGADANESGSLRVALQSVQEELTPRATELNVTIEKGEIPDVKLRCNPGLLHVVFANLCGNAVKFLEGQPERRVRLTAECEGSMCRIDVADTGPGIAKDAQEKIFEPFYRTNRTRAPGSGIGLATVRRILDVRGGRVTVRSQEAKGSCFTVWLPLAEEGEQRAI